MLEGGNPHFKKVKPSWSKDCVGFLIYARELNMDEHNNNLFEGVDFVYVGDTRRDVKDFDPKYAKVLMDTHLLADQLILEEESYKSHGFLAYDHMELQKRIFKEKYNITWRHIYELNPGMIID